jgi:hypothetical protein
MKKYFKELQIEGVQNWNNWIIGKTDRHLYRFITIIIGAYVIDDSSDIDVITIRIRNDIVNFKRNFTPIINGLDTLSQIDVSFRGAFELEVLNMVNANYRYKRDTIYGVSNPRIDINELDKDDRVIVLHIHMLMYGMLDDADHLISRTFHVKRQVDCIGLKRKRQTLEQALDATIDYCFKFRFEYAISDKNLKTRYIGKYEDGLADNICKIYTGLNVRYDRL